MKTVYIHRLAGVLSALGMALADVAALRELSVDVPLEEDSMRRCVSPTLETTSFHGDSDTREGVDELLERLQEEARNELKEQGIDVDATTTRVLWRLLLRYAGTDQTTPVNYQPGDCITDVRAAFEAIYEKRFGITMPDKTVVVDTVAVEVVSSMEFNVGDFDFSHATVEGLVESGEAPPTEAVVEAYMDGEWHQIPLYIEESIKVGAIINGPAIISGGTGTTVVEPGWKAAMGRQGMILERVVALPTNVAIGTSCDPLYLEIFNNLFMSIAEQMGYTLMNTAFSVNMKERLDFSCAIFDSSGNLIANAPHMPVHLGSMGESIRTVIRRNKGSMHPGDVYILNDPYNGGTHLPDVTVVTPVFLKGSESEDDIIFYVGSRGHQADIGGITPASMPPMSRHISEEGILIDNFKLVDNGVFKDEEFRALLCSGKYPVRSPDVNMADIRAQMASNVKGIEELQKIINHFGLDTVLAYMNHVQDNAEEAVRRAIAALHSGQYTYELDDGSAVQVKVSVDTSRREAIVDFSGTSAEVSTNFNAPSAVCRAAVMYVFRTLVNDDIPMNEGCLRSIDIKIPPENMLNPSFPAAVVAGNVETSQVITDAIYGALGVMAASQGTMNNVTFGNDSNQYYETVCGGSGAGPKFHGTDSVHTHMTNSRMTDPEVLENRYPVLVESFTIRRGSGGRGLWNGGDGVERRLTFNEAMDLAIVSNRRKVPPYGMNGGDPGSVGKSWIVRHEDGSIDEMSSCDLKSVAAGDTFVLQTPGGGGYGSRAR